MLASETAGTVVNWPFAILALAPADMSVTVPCMIRLCPFAMDARGASIVVALGSFAEAVDLHVVSVEVYHVAVCDCEASAVAGAYAAPSEYGPEFFSGVCVDASDSWSLCRVVR